MLRQLIAGVAASCALLQVARASTGTSYSFKTVSGCSTASGTGGTVPQSLPTVNTESTVSSVVTAAVATVPSPTSVTVAPVTTTTVKTSTTYTVLYTTTSIPTSTSWREADSIVATATWPTTECTNGVNPSTVTKYSGIYTPIPGQVTTIPASYPTEVLCSTGITWFTILQPTVTSGTTTITVTPTSTVYSATSTSTYTFAESATVYGTTVSSVTTSYRLATSVAAVRTACSATTTTTFAAKCAPTNVISGVDDRGIVSGRYATNITVVYVPDERYYDPSTCCQLCVDNAGCAGSMSGFAGDCGLLYVGAPNGGPECGDFAFSYGTQSDVFPGQSLWVQSGCGVIEYDGPDGV
ncbi:hypothetical protein GGR54DRAFT_79212 [Hypoxylon sp. NC1633]|nr:hypothetical protein GGR54DRAFT_79212 [Hypoxylon sp. NC1633]